MAGTAVFPHVPQPVPSAHYHISLCVPHLHFQRLPYFFVYDALSPMRATIFPSVTRYHFQRLPYCLAYHTGSPVGATMFHCVWC